MFIMKKILAVLVVVTLSFVLYGQSPEAFKYQSVVRDAKGNVLKNQTVSFRVSILKGSTTGTSEYIETHDKTTNLLGLVNLEIGNGTPVTGSFLQY
jgi:hypothetical protein